jgi:CPA2 family monovalent cation:H+ antiporter-2
MMGSGTLITTILLLLSAALMGGVVAARLKLPTIVGYIGGGILIGNLLYRFVDHSLVSVIAESGVTLLLFSLGVEFSFHRLRRVFSSIAWPTMAQIVLTVFIVLFLLIAASFSFVPALYLSCAVALSSTVIVVKILSEKGELDTVPGEIATGWLVVQDIAVVPLLILLSAASGVVTGDGSLMSALQAVGIALIKSAVAISLVVYLGRHGVPKLLSIVASYRNREMLLLTTIGIVFLIGLFTYAAGLSVALGAFLAGLLVADTSQNHAVFAEIRPLRDLFAVVFFVSLGMALPISTIVQVWPQVLLLTISAIIVKWAVSFGLLRFVGYHRKTAFLVGLMLAQVSEFGFVLSQAGLAQGALTPVHAAMLTAVTFLSVIVSAPLIANDHAVYYAFAGILKKFPKLFPEKSEAPADLAVGYPIRDHVVICGYGRVGKYIGRALQMADIPFLVVDYNQHVLKQLKDAGVMTVYGDPADKDVLDYAQVDFAKAVVVAIPDRHTQELIIANSVSLNRRVKIICRTHHEEDQRHLKSLGVQMVIQPEFEAALTIVSRLLTDFGVPAEEVSGKMSRLKIEHGIG